jgi:hypothetical protein
MALATKSLRKQTSRIIQLLSRRRQVRRSLVLHNSRFTEEIHPEILVRILCPAERSRFSRPSNLAILAIHNRKYKTVFEKSLDYLGVEGYAIVTPRLPRGIWRNTYKIPAAVEFLKSCSEEYVLYVDSDDAVLTGDPARAIDFLQESGGEMLISTTPHADFIFMPGLQGVFERAAESAGFGSAKALHLNSGVYVGRRSFLLTFLQDVSQYITEEDARYPEYTRQYAASLNPPQPFPVGCGSDQNIFRFLYPKYADAIRLDYAQKLALR